MTTIEVVDSTQLDYEAFTQLEKVAFAELFAKTKSEDLMSPTRFQWKHSPPAGRGKIAVVYEGSKLVAANAMFPLLVRLHDAEIMGWQSCDTATLPEARGKGYFLKCLKGLQDVLGPDEFFFGFPNKNSVSGFYKVGWTEICEVTTWARLVGPFLVKEQQCVVEIDDFPDQQDTLGKRVAAMGHAMLDRSAAYMRWRYCKHPNFQYTKLAFRDGRELLGTAVFRTGSVMGHRCAILMELLGVSSSVEYSLLRAIIRRVRKLKLPIIFGMNTNPRFRASVLAGFLPLPKRLLPKRQVLMGQGNGAATSLLDCSWLVQTGDWDAL